MPTVAALVWKNMFMNPVNGLFAASRPFLRPAADRLVRACAAVFDHLIVAWQWLPFRNAHPADRAAVARRRAEGSRRDGRRRAISNRFIYLTLPHMARAITVVILIQTIFLLGVFAEILVTTNGGPGTQSTNLTFLIYVQALLQFDVGGASAGGIVAVILANIVAFFLIRLVGKNLET
jgi:sorbitol/mannitol transport system permease protein